MVMADRNTLPKAKKQTPGSYKALNAALDQAQEEGVMPTIQMAKTLEQHITEQYKDGPWSKGDHTIGEESQDDNVDMLVVPPGCKGQEDWIFEEASPVYCPKSPGEKPLDWGSDTKLKEYVHLPFLYLMFNRPTVLP